MNGLTIGFTIGGTITVTPTDVAPPEGAPVADFLGGSSLLVWSGSGVTLPVPAGTVDGDLVVVAALAQGLTDCVWLPDSGWFSVGEHFQGSITAGCWAFLASGLGPTIWLPLSEPIDDGTIALIASYRPGLGTGLAIDTASTFYFGLGTTDVVAPAVTTTRAHDLLIHTSLTWDEVVVSAPAGGFVLPAAASITDRRGGGIAHKRDAGAAGSTGPVTATITPASNCYAFLLAAKLVNKPVPPVRGPASFIGATSKQVWDGTALTLDVPVGTVDGDLVVVSAFAQGLADCTWVPPAEWFVVGNHLQGSITAGCWAFVASGLGPTVTIPLTQPIDDGTIGLVGTYRAPVGFALAIDVASTTMYGGGAVDVTAPSVTTTAATDLLVHATLSWDNATITPPTGFTLPAAAFFSDRRTGALCHDSDAGAAGPTGPVTATLSGWQPCYAFLLAAKLVP